ncbi:ZYBA0S13-01244g1_1 [Zygosaccharomyces bailii CLIB 213]|uniref:Translation initiation factor IF-2, mitochondrial n=1 Tax=Zygosaccharomyces bailii (strain CLIB 213 / ATCC 58445 / CBS 680 / BCRC 21525 / NBRC 1098 / NCYC 1416 / NRRL Y-2227) TaxID=1333698 RepID=A0A8J2TA42_ZYGB2|nr:ZYBA0S13-01244g1_1 [Zygosaccharomyces bailii CLIB 213]
MWRLGASAKCAARGQLQSLRSGLRCCYATRATGPPSGSASAKNKRQSKKLNFVIPNYISVNKLSNLMACRSEQLVRDLTGLGFADVTQDYILSKEYVELILQEYNYKLPTGSAKAQVTAQTVYDELRTPVNPRQLQRRPPVVTIMGHVDHGKTTIIDHLRKSSVVSQEHGGITQHIGAFQVVTPVSKKKITFLDTPGHAAFLKMRQRGANITDIIVLVVSIEDSIMPQTVEAIRHAKNSGNETIIAVSKIDKISQPKERERALERVTADLIAHGIPLEQVGGDVQMVPISARTGENMDLLEESIVLLSDVMDIKAENSSKVAAEGWVLESQVNKSVGNVATVLLKKGCLQKGNILVCGNTFCKVRNILDSAGKGVSKAMPSDAVEVIGWKELPEAGDQVIQAKNEATAKKYNAKRMALLEVEAQAANVERLNQERGLSRGLNDGHAADEARENGDEDEDEEQQHLPAGPQKVNFIVKADVTGSVEAINESIGSLGNDEVVCNIVSSGVGPPTGNDLKMAQITNGKILCFNLGSLPSEVINNRSGVDVRQYNVIYKLIEDVTSVLTDSLPAIYETNFVAQGDIREIFEFSLKKKTIKIAGCRVDSGKISRNSSVQILRGDQLIFDGKLATLKQGRDDASEVTKGHECGITFENGFENYEAGDKIMVYEKVRVPRFL